MREIWISLLLKQNKNDFSVLGQETVEIKFWLLLFSG